MDLTPLLRPGSAPAPVPRHRTIRAPTPRPAALRAMLLAVFAVLSACGGDAASAPQGIPGRDAFVETLVELRVAALEAPTGTIAPETREAILSVQGLDEEALRGFVEFHGTNVAFMAELWTEVERRIAERLGGAPLDPEDLPDPAEILADSTL